MVPHKLERSSETAHAVGILPLAQSRNFVFIEEREGWNLVGQGEPHDDCGSLRIRICPNPHEIGGVTEKAAVKHYYEAYRRSCLRAECPTCYESWSGREAGRIAHRLSKFSKNKVIHVVLSPSHHFDVEKLKKDCLRLARRAGIYGGAVIVHPFVRRCAFCGSNIDHEFNSCFSCGGTSFKWSWKPHFHVLGFGWVRNTVQIYNETGVVIKNLGVRKTVVGTALYQLSHAGIKKKKHTVTWFGKLTYRAFKCLPLEKPKHLCPICKEELRSGGVWVGFFDPKEIGFCHSDEVYFKNRREDYG